VTRRTAPLVDCAERGRQFAKDRGLGDTLAPVPWTGPPPAPTADCGRWVLMRDGATYTCAPDAWHPVAAGPNLKRVAQYALIALGFVAGAVAYSKRSLPAYLAANAASLSGTWWLYADGGANVVWPLLSTALTGTGAVLDTSRWRKT
jgi:hypothetical protein